MISAMETSSFLNLVGLFAQLLFDGFVNVLPDLFLELAQLLFLLALGLFDAAPSLVGLATACPTFLGVLWHLAITSLFASRFLNRSTIFFVFRLFSQS